MDPAEPVILVGFVEQPEDDAAALLDMEADVRLARILLRRKLVSPRQLEEAARLQRETGRLLEHCVVRLGHVGLDEMLDVMAERRASANPAGDAAHRRDTQVVPS